MCGICGIIDIKKDLSSTDRRNYVLAMNKAIIHRGPDDKGLYLGDNCTLAMRRLSIIDIKGGTQPVFNEAGNICCIFNGEIYNFQKLKQKLEKKGRKLRTSSDTEVLLRMYEEHGKDMLLMLKGMFAFCIYDKRKNIYLLARDRFGEKPLYYHWNNKTFSFSSEIKSLLKHSNIARKLNIQALPYYFRTSLVPEPMTLFENINTLPAGHYIEISEDKFETQAYFHPSYKVETAIKTEEDAIDFIRPYLTNAVKRQMVSDVPIGAFLSGGIDSGTIVALLQKNSPEKVKTFNVRFEGQGYDESPIARKVAKYYETDHHEIHIPDVDFDEDIFWEIIDHVGLPFRDTSAIPSFLISKEISKYVKVALSGDGGDELFGGYDLFQWYQKIIRFKKLPQPIRTTINDSLSLMQGLPVFQGLSALRKIKRGIATSLYPDKDIAIALNEMFSSRQVNTLLQNTAKLYPQINFNDYAELKNYPSNAEDWSSLRKIMYYRLRHTLPANMLIKIDRMSMANSLEVRAPFLDADLFDASLQLPDSLLVKKGKGKYILRKIMEKELPTEVFNHPKTGFNMPLHRYQNDTYKKLARQLLFDENPWPNFIPKQQLETIYKRGISTQKNTANGSVFRASHQLWMMMQLFAWAKKFNVQIE